MCAWLLGVHDRSTVLNPQSFSAFSDDLSCPDPSANKDYLSCVQIPNDVFFARRGHFIRGVFEQISGNSSEVASCAIIASVPHATRASIATRR